MISNQLGPSLTEMAEQKGYERGEQKGYERGEQKGYEKGEQKAYRESLKLLLSSRFGELPEEIIQRIDEATIEKVRDAIGKTISLKNLSDLEV